jgi:SNF2 family DNA or RNA helicase
LIVVPTSVMLNWEMELRKWAPAFKLLTYYGTPKERRAKRQGWSKPNAFHVCVTSYRLVLQDHQVFRRKKWKYLILDEAHHIKNFRSQRWQTLLGFNAKYRLLLTGTPLQNNLSELWSLMHFLMPHIFQSHSHFKKWFSKPVADLLDATPHTTGAGNDVLISRLHSVLRPFLLRRLKQDVEQQLPRKVEHLVPCRLSKRQRLLYEEFMASAATRDKLASGNYLSIVNVLMQLRKVCNHPDLFEGRPIISPFDMNEGIVCTIPSVVMGALAYQPLLAVDLRFLNLVFLLGEPMTSWQAESACNLRVDPLLFTDSEFTFALSTTSILSSLRRAMGSVTKPPYRPACAKLVSGSSQDQPLVHAAYINEWRCAQRPLFGRDLRRCVRVRSALHLHNIRQQTATFGETALTQLVTPYERRAVLIHDTLIHFTCIIPRVRARGFELHCSHPDPSFRIATARLHYELCQQLTPRATSLHTSYVRQQIYFPDKRLVQYDCGKLQELDRLLRRLKSEGHRALIFTQMSRMLDVLEVFLNIHGHTYLRLDGATKVEQRQQLMERFNADPRIFLFILSTRAGGIGVNLTGADTVIFYDSDWNPAMDQQVSGREFDFPCLTENVRRKIGAIVSVKRVKCTSID